MPPLPRPSLSDALRQESEKLVRCWMQHEANWLGHYLVAGVEDPRRNVQSILSRHFLVRALFGDRFDALMIQEILFAAVMNWLLGLSTQATGAEDLEAVLHALKRRADNAEGIPIPHFVLQAFATL